MNWKEINKKFRWDGFLIVIAIMDCIWFFPEIVKDPNKAIVYVVGLVLSLIASFIMFRKDNWQFFVWAFVPVLNAVIAAGFAIFGAVIGGITLYKFLKRKLTKENA
jgi:ABC-type Na+ efflux pump permease subunit